MTTRTQRIAWRDGEGNTGTVDVPITVTAPPPPPPPGGRIDVRTYDWNAVGRPAPTVVKTGSVNTNGADLLNADVPGDVIINANTNLVQNCKIGGYLNVWTGKRLKQARRIYMESPPANGIGNVDAVEDFRIDGIGNDGLVLSKGGPPATFTPVPYPAETLAERGVILNRGFLPAGSAAHADNVQLWSGRNYTFKKLWLGGVVPPAGSGTGRVNSLVIIKSDIVPWDGLGDPITNVLLEDIYFDLSVGTGYNNVIYLREGGGTGTADLPNRYQRRPKMVTFRGCVFSDLASGAKPAKSWVMNTSYQTDYAVFVRTEAERQTGLDNQQADPSVIQRRMTALSASRSGKVYPDLVDAASWIVWEADNCYQDGSPLVPLGGMYNLAAG